jgi:hypothetical protein
MINKILGMGFVCIACCVAGLVLLAPILLPLCGLAVILVPIILVIQAVCKKSSPPSNRW